MSEQFSPERPDETALAAERSEVCDAACAERVALNAELGPEQLRTGELIAYIVGNYPDCAEPELAAGACFERETQMRGLMGDSFDITTNPPLVTSVLQEFEIRAPGESFAEIRREAIESEHVTAVETVDLRNGNAAAVLAAAERTGVELPDVPAVREASALGADTTEIVVAVAGLEEVRETVAEPAVARMENTIAANRVRSNEERNLNSAALDREDEIEERMEGAAELQAKYEKLRSTMGQKEALQQLLSESDNPEHQDRLTQILGNISTLENALPPERRAAVSRFIENSNLDLGAANSAAVFAEVFANMEASDDFTAEEVAVLRASIGGTDIATGGDANDAFERGRAETYTDENGNEQTRYVPLEPGERVEFGEGHELGLDETGQRQAWVRTDIGVYQAHLPEGATDKDMGDIIRTVQLRAKLHELNAAPIFFTDVEALEFGGGMIDVHPDHYPITERFLGIVTGNRALAGNQLLQSTDLRDIDYLLQFHDSRGDIGRDELDADRLIADYQAQGIVGPDGALNWDRFSELVDNNRSHRYSEATYRDNLV